jgi:hypothetical protein
MEAGLEVLELHLLQSTLLQEARLSGVVMEHLAVPILLGGPEVVPQPPEAVVPQVYGEQAVEMGQPFLGEEVEGQRRPG